MKIPWQCSGFCSDRAATAWPPATLGIRSPLRLFSQRKSPLQPRDWPKGPSTLKSANHMSARASAREQDRLGLDDAQDASERAREAQDKRSHPTGTPKCIWPIGPPFETLQHRQCEGAPDRRLGSCQTCI